MSEAIEKHVLRKYEIVSKLGKGVCDSKACCQLTCATSPVSQAYGIVWKAIDKRSKKVVAVKKCFDAFRNATDAQVG